MGNKILYENKQYDLQNNETVLDCLLREGLNIPHSCKAGSCQSCLMKMISGDIPEAAQQGLKPSFKQMKLFLACQCLPKSDISVQLPNPDGLDIKASITGKELLSSNVLRVSLRLESDFEYRAGQYITITNNDGIVRSYSIANKTNKDGNIDLHVRLLAGGKMSLWLQEVAKIGDEVTVRGPAGDCFYLAGEGKDYPIIMAGTGTGLAPLYGILLDALENGHTGRIDLYHGALKEEDLYFVNQLQKIAAEYSNFVYTPCVLLGRKDLFIRLAI